MVARKFANLLQPDGLDAANPTHELGQDLRGALELPRSSGQSLLCCKLN